MQLELTRRATLIAAPALVAAKRLPPPQKYAYPFRDIEKRSGGRLGVVASIPDYPTTLVNRPGERFPMCSSFKFILAGCVLARADAGHERLDALVPIPAAALLSHAPVTTPVSRAGEPLSVEQLCEAAVKVSDNTAANLLLQRVGGPAGLTRWMRRYDPVTRLDRNEPALNESRPGDPRDTTSPGAMMLWLQTLLYGDALKPASRALLLKWMTECTTGLTKIRAGLPLGWTVADKTGNNGSDTAADVAALIPPGGAPSRPILVSVYVTQSKLRGPELDAIFAEVGRIVSGAFARG